MDMNQGGGPVRPPVGGQAGRRDQKVAILWQRADRTAIIAALERINREAVDREAGLARRAQHRKHHGCVRAIFRVRDDIPADLRQGLFAKSGCYEALIRFSNGTQGDDRRKDSHGMAIKLLGVDGSKILSGRTDERAQDFLLADDETFPSGSPRALILLNRLLSGRRLTRWINGARLAAFHPRTFWRSLRALRRISSLLDISYFSAIPYRLGDHAVKYVVAPRQRIDGRNYVDDRDGLGTELRQRLRDPDGRIIFEFGVDVRLDEDRQPIEDPSIAWHKIADPRREWLAEILVPCQELDDTEGLAENLAFSPWHAREEHSPLGLLAEARRDVYRSLARHRHERNQIVPTQSSEVPAGYADGRPRTFGSLYWDAPRLSRRKRFWKKVREWLALIARELPFLIWLIDRIGPLQRASNWSAIDYFASQTAHRPLPLSLWKAKSIPITRKDPANYGASVSWPGLVERSFTGRHLPPIGETEIAALPELATIRPLFERRGPPVSDRSSALFGFFAQWLTDSFLRTHPDDRRLNTSTQELDLCQIYGLGEEATRLLRAEQGGRLKSRSEDCVGELPPFLVNPKTLKVKREFARIAFDPIHAASFNTREPPHGRAAGLRKFLRESSPEIKDWAFKADRWRLFYAGGLERGNSTILYSAFNTLFLREHNRLAGELQRRYASRDDDWLFETARNINIVKYLKIIVEDYINHLLGSTFKLRLAQGMADRSAWYRANRITLEFNLLYRWHALVPNEFRFEGSPLPNQQYRFNNIIVERAGIEPLFEAASRQPAGHIQLFNTPDFLVSADVASVGFARQFRLAGFNAYRKRWALKPYESFYEMTGDWDLAFKLASIYRDRDGVRGVDRVELPVGLYAEKRDSPERVLPELLSLMVASDAFSHALTNPLLAANVYGPDSLSEFGCEEIERFGRKSPGVLGATRGVATLEQLVRDNCLPERRGVRVSFDRLDAD
jgi:prostaglandin-endoperoxide synthase 2